MAGARDRPGPALAVLTGVVLCVHVALLTRMPHWRQPLPAVPARAWAVRAVPPAAPAALPAATPSVKPRPAWRDPPPARTAARMAAVPAHAASEPAPPTAPPAPPSAAVHAPQALPEPARWFYDVQIQVRQQLRHAQGALQWQHDGGRYLARLELGEGFAAGPRLFESAGRIGPQGLAPARFTDAGRRTFAAHFDADAARVVFSANTPEAALQAGAQDRLSVLVHLAALLAGAPARYPRGSTISVQTIGAREAELWTFTVEGDEVVELPSGPATLRKLSRAPERTYDARLEVWFDPQRGHLPARIRTTLANGDWLDQRLRNAETPERH